MLILSSFAPDFSNAAAKVLLFFHSCKFFARKSQKSV